MAYTPEKQIRTHTVDILPGGRFHGLMNQAASDFYLGIFIKYTRKPS
jgi:hypothetical protein